MELVLLCLSAGSDFLHPLSFFFDLAVFNLSGEQGNEVAYSPPYILDLWTANLKKKEKSYSEKLV